MAAFGESTALQLVETLPATQPCLDTTVNLALHNPCLSKHTGNASLTNTALQKISSDPTEPS